MLRIELDEAAEAKLRNSAAAIGISVKWYLERLLSGFVGPGVSIASEPLVET